MLSDWFKLNKSNPLKRPQYQSNFILLFYFKLIKKDLEDEFQTEPMDETSYETETVEMRCDPPKGEPLPSVYWLKDEKEIDTVSDSSRYKLSNDYSLLILASRKQDSGNYVCVAYNQIEKRKSKPAKLTVLESFRKYELSQWSDWSACNAKCGSSGLIKRTRACQTKNKLGQVQNVSLEMCKTGEPFEDLPCSLGPCTGI